MYELVGRADNYRSLLKFILKLADIVIVIKTCNNFINFLAFLQLVQDLVVSFI